MKLLGYRAAPAAWHPRFVLPSVAADEGERGTNYDLPPGCPEIPVILTEYLRWALARTPHCHLHQVKTARTQLRKPEFFDSISPGPLAATPSNSEPLMPNSARRRVPASSRGSEPCMCSIGHLSSRGRLPVSQEPSHSLSGTEGAASGSHPLQAIHIKAESHDDTLIFSIYIYSQNVKVMPAAQLR